MANVGFFLLLFGSFQLAKPQIPEWTEDLEGSGKTSPAGLLFTFL